MTYILSMRKRKLQKVAKNKLKEEINNYIINWNTLYPIDYWWRKKYNIPFGSEEHRQTTFLQMFYDYEEDKLIQKVIKKDSETEEGFDFEKAQKKSGVGKNMSQQQIDDDFDKLDLSSYNIKKEPTEKDG